MIKLLPRVCWYCSMGVWYPGILHSWGQDHINSDPIPIGVVEDPEGEIHSVFVGFISFAEK